MTLNGSRSVVLAAPPVRHDIILEAARRLAQHLHERVTAFGILESPAWLAAKPLIQEVVYENIAS